jgi:putative cell wall-binding protein/uncharacterized protein (DUF2141 family)
MHQGISRFRKMAVAAAATVATTAGLLPLAAGSAGAAASFDLTRFAGADRYDTAAKIATGTFTTVDTVVIATGENFPDALAGNYIAGQTNSPILLTQKNSVPAATQAAIATLKPTKAVVLGGTDAIAAGGVPTGVTVTRYAGADRYATAVAAANAGTAVGSVDGLRTAIVASGENFPDALSAGPAAWANDLPLLLTPKSSLDAGTKNFLASKNIQKVILMGGTAAVEESVATAIKATNATTPLVVDRIAGADRTETARLFAEYALSKLGFSATGINVARGDLYPDALSGGPHAGNEKQPILLTVSPTTASNSNDTGVIKYATDHKASLTGGHIFGGVNAVSSAVEAAIEAAGGGGNAPIAVTPTAAASQANNTSRQFSVASSGPVTIALFQCSNIRQNSAGQTTFTTVGGQAQQGTPNATITVVNGSPASTTAPSTTTKQVSVTSSSGTITFTVSGPTTTTNPGGCVIPVVFTDVNNNGFLDTDANGVPTEPFGLGGSTTFGPAAATAGAVNPVVLGTDKANDAFVACDSATPTTCATYKYDANDTFTIGGVSVGLATFEAALSPFDTLTGTYTTDPAGVSVFNLTDAAPVAPGGLTATQSTTAPTSSIVLQWTDSATPTTDAYNVYRTVANADVGQTCPDFNTAGAANRDRFTKVATVNDKSGSSAADGTYTYTDTSLGSNTKYCYAVTSVDEGDESLAPVTPASTANAATASPAPTAVPGAPISTAATFQDVADLGAGFISSGDVLTVVFNEAMAAPQAGDSITLTDGDGTVGTLINGTNATFALVTTGTNANKAITITVTGPPNITTVGTTAGLQYGSSTVTTSNGNTDADESLEWNLAGSTDKTF